MPLVSRDIKLCAQKVEPQISRESLAVRGRGPRSLSDALTGRTAGKNSGRLELRIDAEQVSRLLYHTHRD
jgi:hypothetical protein